MEARCGRAAAAEARVESLVRRGDAASVAFAWLLARNLPDFDRETWAARLKNIASLSPSAAGAWAETVRGLIELETGDAAAAQKTLASVILLPDRNLAHHYSRSIRGLKL